MADRASSVRNNKRKRTKLTDKIIRSEKSQLSAAGGFRKKGPNLYRLAEIISPIDDEIVSS